MANTRCIAVTDALVTDIVGLEINFDMPPHHAGRGHGFTFQPEAALLGNKVQLFRTGLSPNGNGGRHHEIAPDRAASQVAIAVFTQHGIGFDKAAEIDLGITALYTIHPLFKHDDTFLQRGIGAGNACLRQHQSAAQVRGFFYCHGPVLLLSSTRK